MIEKYSRLLVLPHSVFALPFAGASFVIAARVGSLLSPTPSLVYLSIVMVFAVVFARTAAMSFNRLIDADLDAQNPRTCRREIPAGKVKKGEAKILCGVASGLFLFTSYLLGWHCFFLAPFVLAILLAYSYCKRFTSSAHFILGLALALAPGGAWWILRPEVELTPLLLMAGVMCWVSGFDLLYSCQDICSDRKQGLFSIPARVGIERAFYWSRVLHVLAVLFLAIVGLRAELGVVYFLGVCLQAAILVIEHRLISPFDLTRINQAFFTMNGILSVLYFFSVLLSSSS